MNVTENRRQTDHAMEKYAAICETACSERVILSKNHTLVT